MGLASTGSVRLGLEWHGREGSLAKQIGTVRLALLKFPLGCGQRGPPLLGRLSLEPRHHAFYRDSREVREALQLLGLDAAIGPYFAPRVKVVQQWVSTLDRHALAILTGYVSHARYASLSGLSVSCVHCGLHDGTREHTWWHCPVVSVRSVPASACCSSCSWA